MAVQFAQRVGATIFATAGSPGKVQHLKDLGVTWVLKVGEGGEVDGSGIWMYLGYSHAACVRR